MVVIFLSSNLTGDTEHLGSPRQLTSTNSSTKPGTPALSKTGTGTLSSFILLGNTTKFHCVVEVDGNDVAVVSGRSIANLETTVVGFGHFNFSASTTRSQLMSVPPLNYESTLKIYLWQDGTTGTAYYTHEDR